MKMPNDIYQTMLEETAEIRDGKVWYSLKSANLAYATIMPVVHMDSYFTERPTRMENIDEITFDSLVNLKALHHKTIGVNK